VSFHFPAVIGCGILTVTLNGVGFCGFDWKLSILDLRSLIIKSCASIVLFRSSAKAAFGFNISSSL
jgi:hypothetical protein